MIIVTGAKGMLGQRVVEVARKDHQVLELGHGEMNIADGWQVFNWAQAWTEDDILINCAGIPGDIADPWTMIQANSLGPHYLAAASKQFGFKMIHVSTDCVFSGWDAHLSPRKRSVQETPNPDSFYGRTKHVGEPYGPRVSSVRTSFIGPEHGVMRWFLEQPQNAMVTGWRDAWWSGSTVWAVARALVDTSWTTGLHHLATENPITKIDVLRLLARDMGRMDIEIASAGARIDRSLSPTTVLPSLEEALGWGL